MDENLYVKKEDDKPFDAKEVRFWSVQTMFKFLLIGLPRMLLILILYIVFVILLFTLGQNEKMFEIVWRMAARIQLNIMGYKELDIDKESLDNIKNSKSQIIVVKHASYSDILLMLYLFPEAYFIASDFMGKIPIVRNMSAKKCLFLKDDFYGNLTGSIEKALKEGKRIVFFSEGVCSNPKYLLKLRSGAFVPKMNILPVYISYGNENYWVNGEQDMTYHILSHVSNRRNTVKVRVLPEYVISDDQKNGDIQDLIENFRNYYAKGFNIKLSNLCYKDHPYYRERNSGLKKECEKKVV